MQKALFVWSSLLLHKVCAFDNISDTIEESCNCGSLETALTIALAIVSALLLVALIAVLLLYCKVSKLKNEHKKFVVRARDSANGKQQTMFTKHEGKKAHSSISNTSSPTRRPTGIALGFEPELEKVYSSECNKKVDFDENNPNEIDQNDSQQGDSPKEYRKTADRRPTKFVFNKSEHGDDGVDDEDEEDDSPKQFRKTADRRPTKFVFGNPLEPGLYDEPNDEESSDEHDEKAPKVTKESRKSVTFDEHVERIPMGSKEPELTIVEVGGKESLPSEIFKEIF